MGTIETCVVWTKILLWIFTKTCATQQACFEMSIATINFPSTSRPCFLSNLHNPLGKMVSSGECFFDVNMQREDATVECGIDCYASTSLDYVESGLELELSVEHELHSNPLLVQHTISNLTAVKKHTTRHARHIVWRAWSPQEPTSHHVNRHSATC